MARKWEYQFDEVAVDNLRDLITDGRDSDFLYHFSERDNNGWELVSTMFDSTPGKQHAVFIFRRLVE